MKLLLPVFICLLPFSDNTAISGHYYGFKDDRQVHLFLDDDNVYEWERRQDFPFEVSEGTWKQSGDTLILNSEPCKNPEALKQHPVRTYLNMDQVKFLILKNTLVPVRKNKLIKEEKLTKE
ncbi:MAG: hypothetical protein Fur0041_22310 [Bacteroidia bacterium]